MALNDVIANIINSQMTLFFEKLNEKYDIEISEMQEIWENMEGAPAPVKKGKAKKAKDPNAPKKPRSAYIFFSTEKRPIVKEEEPKLTFGDLNRRLGEMWQEEKSKDSKEYKRFMKMAEDEKENGRPVEEEKPKKAPAKAAGKAPAKKPKKESDSESKAESDSDSKSSEEEKPEKKPKGNSGKGKTVEKCGRILQTGKNKGSECGAPVKENGLCGRHLVAEKKGDEEKKVPAKKPTKKSENESEESSEDEKPKKDVKKTAGKASAKKPTKKSDSEESSGDEKKGKEKKGKEPKGLKKVEIKNLSEKLTELDEGKFEAIVIRNTEKDKKINYYVITAIEDELYNVEGDLFAGEMELEEGCENDKDVIMAQLVKEDIQDFFTIDKGCEYIKIVKGLPKVF